jgi:hypothetical protein
MPYRDVIISYVRTHSWESSRRYYLTQLFHILMSCTRQELIWHVLQRLIIQDSGASIF